MIQNQLHKSFYQHIKTLNDFRSILCLSGNLPDKDFFDGSLPIIAADGAANHLINRGVYPELVVGDLDSFSIIGSHIKTLYAPDQASSDFEKVIDYAKKKKLFPAIILGINGGYIDHILNNINIFLTTDSIFYDPPIVGYVLKKGIIKNFFLPHLSKLSLIGIPSACITTSGLKWNITKGELSFPGSSSYFNRSLEEKITVNVHDGVVLVLIYLTPIQDAGKLI